MRIYGNPWFLVKVDTDVFIFILIKKIEQYRNIWVLIDYMGIQYYQ